MLLSLHISTILAEETTQGSSEQLSNLGSGGPWVTTMTGKTTTSSGRNGNPTRYSLASNLGKKSKSKSKRRLTRRGAPNRLVEVPSTVS